MMFPSFASTTLTRVRPVMIDDHGTQVPDWTAPGAELSIPGWSVQPGASPEVLQNRQNVTVRWTAYGPAGADVLATDAIRYDGTLYAVDGEPARWPSPTGGLAHTVLLLVDHRG
ncbi:hypothetical protein [Isoptericola sp. NPDC056134]|uniref:hypothetical protein n=1 Tax=Isoptericola sp. NPDC056134 TaxID=3345723 RepID=UPI0035EBBB60